jgi:hypothetical protein
MIELERVVQLRCRRGERWEGGSGYLLADGVVLTAAHIVTQADPVTSIEARLFQSASWCKASVPWSDAEVDVALLRVEAPADTVSGAPPACGQVKGTLAPVEAIGFPAFGVIRKNLRDTEHLLGQLRLLSGVRAGLLEVDVIGQRIEADNWSGMSGAALFCKGRLVGVVIEAIRDTGRLVAQPLWKLADRNDFLGALGELGVTIVVETIVGMSGPQPALVPKLLKGAPTSRLAYSARVTPLLGRDRERHKLGAFLEDSHTFLWWMVTGGSGSGKSRLALELTLLHWGNWWTGFLAAGQDASFWSNWKPEWPTLMVVDYVGARATEIGEMVNTLQERAIELGFPVRVLLIARSAEEPWWKEFLGRGSRTNRESILSARFDVPLQLQGLSPQDNWVIIEHDLGAADVSWSATEKHYLMETLSRIDPSGSPLYAMLLADAFAHSEKGPWDSRSAEWDAALLVENVIERERVQWEAVGMTAEDQHALALATILGGLNLEIMEDNRAQGLLPAPKDYRPERFKAITGKPAEVEVPPLSPSLVGESFVLALPSSKIDRTLRSLARLAFELNAVAASQFVLHACMDFPRHANVEHLLPSDPRSLLAAYPVVAGGDEVRIVTYIPSALALTYARLGMPTQASQVCQIILDWLKSRPDDPELQESSAHTLYNLIACATVQGEMKVALSNLNVLGALWTTMRAPAFGVAMANALFAVGTRSLDSGVDTLTRQAVDELERLSVEAPYPEVKTARARLLVNVAVEACKKNEIDVATSRCAQLLEIQVEGPLRSEISRLQAKCLRNVCRAQALGGGLAEATKTYTKLVHVLDRDSSLLRWQVVALADLVEGACDASALDEAWSRFQDLVRFADVAEIDSEARIGVCTALGNFALRLCKVPDCARAEQVYLGWRGHKIEEISTCRAVWAQVGANLVSAYRRMRDVVGALRIHSDIRRLLAVDPTNQKVGADLGRATQVLLGFMAEVGMATKATAILADHRRELHALGEDVRENLYMAAVFSFLLGLSNPGGDLEQARDVLRSHRAALTSKEFSESIRDQMGVEVAEEWSRRLDVLLSDAP